MPARVAPSMESGAFRRSDEAFDFPYGFKHGTILTITPEEYDRMIQMAANHGKVYD